jgi:hypothetical protein
MADYSNPTTPLTASGYAWTATLTRGPLKHGSNASHDCTGSYRTQPGATVRDVLAGITTWYAQEYNVPRESVVLVRYSLREK